MCAEQQQPTCSKPLRLLTSMSFNDDLLGPQARSSAKDDSLVGIQQNVETSYNELADKTRRDETRREEKQTQTVGRSEVAN